MYESNREENEIESREKEELGDVENWMIDLEDEERSWKTLKFSMVVVS